MYGISNAMGRALGDMCTCIEMQHNPISHGSVSTTALELMHHISRIMAAKKWGLSRMFVYKECLR